MASVLAALAVLANACGDGDATPTSTPTLEPTASPTVTASPTPTAEPLPSSTPTSSPTVVEAPHAPALAPLPGKTLQGEGTRELTLAAGETLSLDARDFATELSATIVSCIDTTFYLSWQVRDPYPPDAIDLEFYELLRGARILIAEGASGQFTRGACLAFEIVNNSAVEVTVELRYGFDE